MPNTGMGALAAVLCLGVSAQAFAEAPYVSTGAVSSASPNSAIIYGVGSPNGEATIAWFRYGTSSPGTFCNDTFGIRVPNTGGRDLGSSPIFFQNFSESVTGLMSGATYYYCAIAQNASGTAFGYVSSFTLDAPGVTTDPATVDLQASAELRGSAIPNSAETTGWFRYSTIHPGTCSDAFGTREPASFGTPLGSGKGAVAFSNPVTGLLAGTTYFYCAIASNWVGISFGTVESFTTRFVSTEPAVAGTLTTATLYGTANPDGTPATGWFRYSSTNPGGCNDVFGTPAPATGGTALSGTTPVRFSQAISGLTAGTTYWYCALSTNAVGTRFGDLVSFTTPNTPTASTSTATGVSDTAATLNGFGNPRGSPTTGWFRYSATSPGSCNDSFGVRVPATGGTSLGSGSTSVPFNEGLAGLPSGTTLFFCAIAQGTHGTALGSLSSFTTLAAPVVTTGSATSQTESSAILSGTGNPRGAEATGYFRYGTTNPGACTDTWGTWAGSCSACTPAGSSLGSGQSAVTFNWSLSGLAEATTYFYCAAATNSAGTSFGQVMSFTTRQRPTVTTVAATSVTNTSATVNGSANPNGAATTGWFRFSTTHPGACNDSFGTRAPVSGETSLGSGTTALPYQQSLAGLSSGTTYFYCAIASSSRGTAFGTVESFTTLGPGAPTSVTTLAATAVVSNGATMNGSAIPNGAIATGFFRYSGTFSPGTCNNTFGTRFPSTGGVSLGSGSTAVTFDGTVTGLAAGVTFYYCAMATNAQGTNWGTVQSFTIAAPPAVTTTAATSVTNTSATLNGSADPRGSATTAWFRYATVNPGTCNDTFGTRAPATGGTSVGSGVGAVTYSHPVTGLPPGTRYFACAIAQSSAGTSFGTVQSFVTPGPPSVTTYTAATITDTSAWLNGEASPNGLATTGYFRYGTVDPGTCTDAYGTRGPATGGTSLSWGTAGVSFSQNITGLSPGTTYYYCAAATNSAGTSFGQVMSFTTLQRPTVTTVAATSVTSTSATVNGSANPNGAATTGWFRYSTTNPGTCDDTFGTRMPASGGTSLGAGNNSPVAYSQGVTGLLPGTTYYFCAIASNFFGTRFGSVLTFATPAPPLVTTVAPSSVSGTGATLNGTANPNASASTGWFRYATTNPTTCNDTFGTRAPASGGTSLGAGNTGVAFPQALTGLSQGTGYFFCAIASNAVGTSFGSVQTFTTTTNAPTPTTQAATLVTGTTATLNGTTNPNGSAATGFFRYSATDPGSCTTTFGTVTAGVALGAGTTLVAHSQALTGLVAGTTYYFCAQGSNAAGTGLGTLMTFTTPGAPSVTTSPATAITTTSVSLEGAASPNGAATTGWFRYSTVNPVTCNDTFGTRAPATGGATLGAGNSPVTYAQAVTGLAAATTYWFCAVANNSLGTRFGTPVSFTTSSAPVVATTAASALSSTGATLNGAANPRSDATTGWFRYATASPGTCNDTFGTRAPASGGTALGAGSTSAPYLEVLTGLTPGTTYYFCALASNSNGTSSGALLSFTTTDVPVVTTSAASALAATGATLNGSGNPRGAAATGWFRYDTTSPGTCNDTFGTRSPTTGGTSLGAGSTAVSFSSAVTGLTSLTTYYFCAIASNSFGTRFGSVLTFATPAPPLVTTVAASSVSGTGATLNGTANPNASASTGWFRYATTNPTTCNDTFGTRSPASGGVALGSGTTAAPYSQVLTGLTPGATYYFCALASNAIGTAFGTPLSFTVPAAGPVVTTSAATLVTGTTATLNGSANPGGAAGTGWFRYATTSPGSCDDTFGTRAPTTAGTSLGSGNTAVAFTQAVTGLLPGTTYFFCALASNSAATSMGTVLSFITPGAPTVTTLAATAVTGTSATLPASANPNGGVSTGWFRYGPTNPGTCSDTFGTRAPTTAGTALGGGFTVTNFSQSVTGLTPGTDYFFCALASNVVGLSVGTVQTFRTPAAPTVMTSSASNVLGGLATLNGGANPNGAAATGWFRYGPANPGGCNDSFGTRTPASGGSALGAGMATQSYPQNISGLAPGLTYYFCAIASNLVGTAFGQVLSFTVEAPLPTVSTEPATDLTAKEATLNGLANPRGTAATGWFRYSDSTPANCDDTFGTRVPATGGVALGTGNVAAPWSVALTGLKPGVTYSVCAIASNVGGAAFGAVVSFQTANTTPTARTAPAVVAEDGTATLNGAANSNGMVGKAWFQIGRERPTVCTAAFGEKVPPEGFSLGDSEAEVPLSHVIPGAPGTFYFCAVAETAGGTAFGEVQTFTVEEAQAPGCGCGVGSESASLLVFGLVLLLRARRRR